MFRSLRACGRRRPALATAAAVRSTRWASATARNTSFAASKLACAGQSLIRARTQNHAESLEEISNPDHPILRPRCGPEARPEDGQMPRVRERRSAASRLTKNTW